MRNLLLLILAVIALTVPSAALADTPTGCDGPAELCQQVSDLNAKLAEARAAKEASVAKVNEKVADEVKKDDAKKEERMAKVIAAAGIMAVGLKMLLSLLDSWKGYFTTTKGRAALKLITLGIGFLAFIATNIGMGIPWWQALILAGGGPGAMLVHDISDVIPALTGKKEKKKAEKAAKAAAASDPPPSA